LTGYNYDEIVNVDNDEEKFGLKREKKLTKSKNTNNKVTCRKKK